MSDITRETLDEIIKRVEQKIDTGFREAKDSLTRVEIQTTKTNGNVRDLQVWKAKAQGAIVILAIIMTGIVLPLTFKYLSISLFD